MIDFIRIFASDKNLFEQQILSNSLVDLTAFYNRITGEIKDYPQKGKYHNLYIKITEKQGSIEGSLHKLYNSYNHLGEQNHNDFSFCNYQQARRLLTNKFSLNPINTKITSLEFGINLEIDADPQDILDNMILMYNYNPSNKNYISAAKDYMEFEKTDYKLKVYNKSKHYKLKNRNIIRFELKITKSRYLNKLGIYFLNDLNESAYLRLFQALLQHFDKLTIIDSVSPIETCETSERVLFESGINPNYWKGLKARKSSKVCNRNKRNFEDFINNNMLNSKKIELRCMLIDKFHTLMNCKEHFSEMNISYKNVA